MSYCNINLTPKGQTLKEMSGLSEFSVYSFINGFLREEGRFPELDELPDVNSEGHFDKTLKVKKTSKDTKYTSLQAILEKYGSIDEANAKMNNEYSDLEIQLYPIGEGVMIKTLHRPSEYVEEKITPSKIDFDKTRESNSLVLKNSLDRLQRFYGVKTISVNNQTVPEGFGGIQAFIYNGQIYINTDLATIDAPIHELLHLFLGSIRYANPNLYFNLVEMTLQLPQFEMLVQRYPNRTMNDVQEEIFVRELANYITHQPSLFDNLDPAITSLVMYYVKRDIDSILFGKLSVKALPSIFEKSLLELAEEVNSENFDIITAGTLDDATIHRIMANKKEELLTNNELILDCK